MVKGDRSSSKPSSSARAAEVLANKSSGTGGFGFGNYAGSAFVGSGLAGFGFGAAAAERLAPSVTAGLGGSADHGGGEVPLTVQVDGELAQCIRHLAKKDPITKTKALQNLRALIPGRSEADLLTAMPPWIYMYNRLVLDPSRAVRLEAASTLGCLLTALGKAVAPHLKALMGPWFLAMYDPYGDAADASLSAFTKAFPGLRRRLDAVLYCRTELLTYLKDQLSASPQQLGDVKKDSPEELEERHERVQAASLAALAALITTMTAPPDGEASAADGSASAAPGPAAGRDEVLAAVREIVCRPGFWKGTAGSKSALVRRASYGLARVAAQRASNMLLEGCAAESAICILGALGEKEPGNHRAMWEAVLTYGKFCPGGWQHVNLRKMLLPRLYSLLRHGCYGSASVSLPALLPLLPLLPAGTLGPSPDVLVAVLDAVWTGLQDPGCASRAAKSASLSAYQECLVWGLTNSARLAVAAGSAAAPAAEPTAVPVAVTAATADAEVTGYCRGLLQGTLVQHVLPAALGSGSAAEAARELLLGVAQAVAAATDRGQVSVSASLACLSSAVGQYISAELAKRIAATAAADAAGPGTADAGGATVELATACDATVDLLAQLRGAPSCAALAEQVAAATAQGLMAAGPTGLPPAASQLLATLLREYGGSAMMSSVGAEPAAAPDAAPSAAASGASPPAGAAAMAGTSSFSLDSLVVAFKEGPLSGPAAEASADLLVAFCTTHDNPAALWDQVLGAVLPPADSGVAAAAAAAGPYSAALQRGLLLLNRCSGAAAAAGRKNSDSQATGQDQQEAFAWGSASLDALAVDLARGFNRQPLDQDVAEHAAALLSAALGANAAGLVMLGGRAAAEVVQHLVAHLKTGTGTSASAAGAAGFAVTALCGPLSADRCGLWRLLPDLVCEALAALAQLAWQAPRGGPTRHITRARAARTAHPDVDSGSEEEEEDHDEDASERSAYGASASSSDREEDEKEEEQAVNDGGTAGVCSDALLLRSSRRAAAQFWRECKPLSVAAAALPRPRVGELTRRLADLLAAYVAPAGMQTETPALSPRSWAAHAAQLLADTPGGGAERQGILSVLLAAQPEWRTWTALKARGPGSAPAPSGRAAAAHPSLEYLARLTEAVGLGTLLGDAFDTEDEARGSAGGSEREASEQRDGDDGDSRRGRTWVLVELLCSRHAADIAADAAAAAAATEGASEGDDGEEEDEERDEDGCGSAAGSRQGQVPVSGAWRRSVRRAGEALLKHVVYGCVDEVAAGESTSSGGGVYGGLLNDLLDDLAEGCRDSGAAADEGRAGPSSSSSSPGVAEDRELTPSQAAFLESLCQVVSLMERASTSSSSIQHEFEAGSDGAAQPPLLSQQQRLCRYWLSTCQPDAAASTGLPPQALLRLLPLTAGPIRRAAAAAAAVSSGARPGGGAAEELIAASGLPDLSCAWVRHCLGRPAVLQEVEGPGVLALELASACFPVPDPRGGSGSSSSSGSGAQAAAAALALVRSNGAALASSERPLLGQLVQHQLVRHVGAAAATAAVSAEGSAAFANAARAVVMRIAHAAVVYDWRGLGQAEWHALLQAVQDHMANAVAALSECLGRLAEAARAAADGILQQPAGTTAPGPMALQLLRKLCQRGVLARVPQGRQLEAAAEQALAGCGIGAAAQQAAQLAAVLTDLQDELAVEAGGRTAAGAAAAAREYGNTMKTCCSHAMQLAIALGGVECYGEAFGATVSAEVAAWLARNRDFWAAVTRCAGRALAPGREHVGSQAGAAAVQEQAAALQQAGLDAVGALLAVTLTPGSHVLQPVAYRLLLDDALLPLVTLAETAATGAGSGGSAADIELPQYEGDDVAFLVAGGVRPEMAPWLLPSAATAAPSRPAAAGAAPHGGERVYLTAWALLLAHALNLDATSRGLAVLRQVLREVEPLVHGLLDQVVPELGLQRQQQPSQQQSQHQQPNRKGGKGSDRRGGGGGEEPSSGADVGSWQLAGTLREIGLPLGQHAVRATCRAMYRAVLRALPATARVWFGDLRDRGLAAAVEAYTAAQEGPALLAAEIAAVQALKRGGAGGDDRFTVRASPASREVVATLEVEDGAVLELLVKLPACLPLRAPEVVCRRKVGVNDTRLRKWLLSIATFLRHQNGSVADAIGLWKRNVDSEFEGVEACLICYSVISSVNGQLPRLVCRTCNVRFHPACLYKWFKSAGKSQCPHCQALW